MSTPFRILIVEDRQEDAELVTHQLRRDGIECESRTVATEPAFIEALGQPWDVILADYRLPGFNAFAALEILKRRGIDTPLIIITAVLGDEAAAECIKRGAADYFLKDRLARLGAAVNHAVSTTRMRAEGERKLATAEFLNQRIFETSVDLILVVDRIGNFIQVSPSSLAILGHRPEEMVGRNGIEFVFGDDLEATRNEMRVGRRSGAPRSFQCRYLHKDGRVVTLAWTGIWSAPEQWHYFIGRDMTLRQAMEQQLRQSQKLEAVGQLTGGIAHDFNNLLGVIIGNLDLVMDPFDPKRQESPHLKSALAAAMRGADLVRRLMVFSRRQPLDPSVFAVNDAIAEFEPLLRGMLGEAVELQTQFGEAAGRAAADKHQLENALMNLCVNARDAMPSGGVIRIETASVAVDAASAPFYPDIAPGRYVTISVTDNGTGIASEHLPKVFEPFFTTKTEGKGTGLGLSMVYGFMRESNGMAKIYSELGHGTTVRLYFPATDAELSAEDDDAVAIVLPTGNETVLVVEDRADMRAIAVAVLERLGYRALEADTAAAALAVLNSGAKIDLVFSDIVMPGGMSGLDLAQEIRNRGVKAPILLTSGYASPQALRNQAQKLGIPVVGKPYRVADLAAKVRAMLDGRNGNGRQNGGNGRDGKG